MIDQATHRRAFLAGLAAALPATGAATALAAGPHPDEKLLRLGAALDRYLAVRDAVENGPLKVPSEELDAYYDQADLVVEEIGEIAATTLAGVLVKAKAVLWCHTEPPFDFCEEPTLDARIAASLVRDLLRMPAASAEA
jgi:hypothetical protein